MLNSLHYWPRTYIQTSVVAFLLAVILMPAAIFLLKRFGAMDHPSDAKIHANPTPRGGGIIIFIAFAIAVLIPNYRDHPMKGVLFGSFVCLAVGAWDDFRGGVPAVIKVCCLVGVTLVLGFFDVRLKLFLWYPLDMLITILWIVGITSAFNGLDNMDGLAGGVSAITSTMFLIIAIQAFIEMGTENPKSWFGLLAAGLLGSNLGFLVFNFKPAKVFMGDSGSFFLGFTFGALSVMGEWAQSRVIACTIPILILGVPIFDFAYIIIARIIRGETKTLRQVIEHCAPDHLSHRLCWIGFSQRKAVLFIYIIAIALGVTGILLRNSVNEFDSFLALLQGGAILVIVIILMATAASRHIEFARGEAEKLLDEQESGSSVQRQMELPGVPRRHRLP